MGNVASPTTKNGANGWHQNADKAWDNALYNRYGGLLHSVEVELSDTLDRIAEKTGKGKTAENPLVIFDFGCANGRYIKPLAKLAEEKNLHVKLYEYDIAGKKLAELEQDELLKGGYWQTEAGQYPVDYNNSQNGHRGGIYEKMLEPGDEGKYSFTVQTLRGQLKDNPTPEWIHEHLMDKTPIDLTLSMFGVLSYIPGDENRAKTIAGLNNITDGYMLVSVPSRLRGPEVLDEYEGIRAELKKERQKGKGYKWRQRRDREAIRELRETLGPATEPGDTITPFPNSAGGTDHHFYHYFPKLDDFKNLLNRSGATDYQISVSNIGDEHVLTHDDYLNRVDALGSAMIEPSEFETEGKFFMARVQSSKATEKGYAPLPRESWVDRGALKDISLPSR